ncbi:glycosyltransferase family 2 protein [Roseovarius sp. 10]|uniref:glycosyltransferase family 2 protein n=1 Tax=Roseovarius sp. 10 TaxID=3080563 RepID=UPI002953D05E|nr:glycosyltransferase family 2 protein [Roseovarius sp. 10]MDV7199731.1 glycosyltransferase family 2 protein [Roseovarius sp. 10]
MAKLKISVITVCYNSASTIEQTIHSVSGQTWAETEHIVVDGGSRDGTLGILARHQEKFANVLSEPDQGIYDAMNKGIALATGELIGFLNADDVYTDTEVLARVADVMGREGLDAMFADVEFFSADNTMHSVRRYRSAHFAPSRIAWGWMPAHPTLFLHTRVFEQFGTFRSDYRIAGDFELVARIFHAGGLKYRYLPEVLVRMRTGGASTRGWRNTLQLNREVLRACKENGIYTNPLMILSKYPLKVLEFFFKGREI